MQPATSLHDLPGREPALRVVGIAKRFGGVQALTDVGFSCFPGEVLALVGENGAGKSTLVKIMTGVYRPDGGTIEVNGAAVALGDAKAASSAGITAIHQEAVMFDDLTVAENLMMGRYPRRRPFNAIDWPAMRRETVAALRDVGADLDPDAVVRTLAIAERNMLSIAGAVARDARVIIFDEPTASLSQGEIRALYLIVERLKAAGRAIIFISHKFDELFAVADRFLVLRDGRTVGEGMMSEATEADLVRLMIGRPVAQLYPKADVAIGEPILEAEDLSHPTEFDGVAFTLRRSEVLGFYGLVGAGRTEVMEAVFGLKRLSRGRVTVEGKTVPMTGPEAAIAAGLAYVPEDRQGHGGVLSMSIRANLSLVTLSTISRGPFLSRQREDKLVERLRARLGIKMVAADQRLGELSGGNQQKIVIGKWLAAAPRIVILDEPTKGIDVGAKAAVHTFVAELVTAGLSVILVSSELDEVLGLSDRIVVMHRGRVAGRLDRRAANRETVVRLASGASR